MPKSIIEILPDLLMGLVSSLLRKSFEFRPPVIWHTVKLFLNSQQAVVLSYTF